MAKRTARKSEEVADKQTAELKRSSEEGKQYGRERFEQLFGTSQGEVGEMMGEGLSMVTENLGRYSGAGDAIRQSGNRQARLSRLRSGQMGGQTEAQQAQIGTEAATGAAQQRFKEEQYAQQQYRQVASALASNAVSMEQAYGAEKMAEVRPLSEFDMPKSGIFG